MADALCREYPGRLPTEMLGLKLSPGKAMMVNTRILAYRNEQARLASMGESADNSVNGKPTVPDPAEKIRAKRMAMNAQRRRNLAEYNVTE